MRRRVGFLVALTLALLAAPLAADAQPAGKVTRISVLDAGSAADSSARMESLRGRAGAEHESVHQTQGSMSHRSVREPAAFERANCIEALSSPVLRPEARS